VSTSDESGEDDQNNGDAVVEELQESHLLEYTRRREVGERAWPRRTAATGHFGCMKERELLSLSWTISRSPPAGPFDDDDAWLASGFRPRRAAMLAEALIMPRRRKNGSTLCGKLA